ncbi:restriction endonuclease subunit S [Leptotrichia sp. oral taxon 847]|uniref:restriction endonuclease subunit S n=1 Tax=Leptotrichia sp. oral taxon 847 TaxID=1785996 RepID=UPI0009EC71C9|nr:restriction endonuclease subunit S [Leptotrichia sp. oral taxon 847]
MAKKLEKVKWAKFKIGDLFEKIKVNRLPYKTSELSSIYKENFTLPVLTAGIQNQGLNNYANIEGATILKNVISISANGANTGATFYQKNEFTILQDAYAIKWIFTDNVLTDNQYLYFVASISKILHGKYEWTNKAGWEKVKEEKIQLPIKNDGSIDFEFMTGFISELEACQISKLEAYLVITGFSDYVLTFEEKKILEIFRKDEIEWKEFKIRDLFEVNSYKKRFDANKVNILEKGHPYVVRTALNNGIRGYLEEDEKFLNDGNTISFGQDTATMFYQEKPYFTGDKIKIIKSKYKEFNKLNSHFFVSAMAKSFSMFAWGSSSFNINIIENQEIYLPIKNNEIDFKFIEMLILAIQKDIIKDVVLYTDKKIKVAKKVISNK